MLRQLERKKTLTSSRVLSSPSCMTSSSSSAGSIFDGDESDHAEVIEQLRQSLGPEINRSLNDHDCVRFLRARQGSVSKTVEMVEAWHEWRHSLMDPLPPRHCLRLSPNIILGAVHSPLFTSTHCANTYTSIMSCSSPRPCCFPPSQRLTSSGTCGK